MCVCVLNKCGHHTLFSSWWPPNHSPLSLCMSKDYTYVHTQDTHYSQSMLNTGDNKQASAVVHYCKICHRGFSCGGALGGHMRAHNIAEVINRIQEQQEDSLFRDNREGNKHSYFLRTTSNRFLNFQSSIHGENSSKRARLDDEKQFSPMSSLEEGRARKAYIWKLLGAEGDEKFLDGYFSREEEDLANVLVTLSNNSTDYNNTMNKSKTKEVSMPLAKGLFQCKACKKVFNSHQALGGHRASHKKVKGCYAAKLDDLTDDEMIEEDSISHDENSMHQDSLDPSFKIISRASDEHDSSRAAKVHECSICHRVFSSGQALGGHKRFHWLHTDSTFITPFHDQYQYYGEGNYKKSIAISKESELLDLNLPPHQTFDDKSTTTHTLPQRLNIQVDNNEDQNKGYQKCTDNEDSEKRNLKKVDCYEHNYNKEEAIINNFPKHCSKVRDLKLDGGSSPWLQVGLASTTK